MQSFPKMLLLFSLLRALCLPVWQRSSLDRKTLAYGGEVSERVRYRLSHLAGTNDICPSKYYVCDCSADYWTRVVREHVVGNNWSSRTYHTVINSFALSEEPYRVGRFFLGGRRVANVR